MDFSREKMAESKAQLDRLYGALEGFEGEGTVSQDLVEVLSDDLNTPQALAELHAIATQINKAEGDKTALQAKLKGSALLLGLLEQSPEAWFHSAVQGSYSAEQIETMIQQRIDARKAKDFAEADRIRDALAADKVELLDRPGGLTEWRRL